MVVDRSSSMREEMEFEGRNESRFDVVRRVFADFVLGDKRKGLEGRPSDLLGLSSFALYAEENCPLTLDHENLVAFMEGIDPVVLPVVDRFGRFLKAPPDDGTAIGDALYHAVLVLINAEDAVMKSPKARLNYKIKSKIIILLTDGQQNAGDYRPVQAAETAKKNGIKIYSIAVVPKESIRVVDDLMGRRMVPLTDILDTSEIEAAARMTGGEFFKATDGESLAKIYSRIDELEKSRFSERVEDYDDHFQSWWAVPMGLALLVLEMLLRNTLFRTVP
jgi:Ca-activated chloride channel family protein